MRRPSARRPLLLALAVSATLVALPTSFASAACPGETVAGDAANQQAGRDAALCLLNEVRAKYGLAPLKLDAALNKAAQWHADDMVRRKYFNHSAPAPAPYGVQPWDRTSKAGFTVNAPIAEGISGGSPTVFGAVTGQLKSPGHCIAPLTTVNSYFGFGMAGNNYVFIYSSPSWEGTKEPAAQTRCGEVNKVGVGREPGVDVPAPKPPAETGDTAGNGTSATPQSQRVSNLFVRDGKGLPATRKAGRAISFRLTCDNTCKGTFVVTRPNGKVVKKQSFKANSKGRTYTVRLSTKVDRDMRKKGENALDIAVNAGTGRAGGTIYLP